MPVACQVDLQEDEDFDRIMTRKVLIDHIHDNIRHDLNPNEFVDVEDIGYGNGGLVFKTLHKPTGIITARKIFNSRIPSESQRRMLERELLTLQKCCSPNILHYFGSMVSELQVSLILEYMDLGSLSDIVRGYGPLPEPVLGMIAYNVLNGLSYLHEELNMIHRDLKPSNILVNSKGEVKLCDFGDSVELINSHAQSVVGTMGYMAPERIQGFPYSATSDVWSLGVTMMELATGQFPFGAESNILTKSTDSLGNRLGSIAVVELLEAIINDPMPKLNTLEFSLDLNDFVQKCLIRDPLLRPKPNNLISHIFVQKHSYVSLADWAHSLMQEQQS